MYALVSIFCLEIVGEFVQWDGSFMGNKNCVSFLVHGSVTALKFKVFLERVAVKWEMYFNLGVKYISVRHVRGYVLSDVFMV